MSKRAAAEAAKESSTKRQRLVGEPAAPQHIETDLSWPLCGFTRACHKLQKVAWNGSQDTVSLLGHSSSSLAELYVDNSQLESLHSNAEQDFSGDKHALSERASIECLSVKSATWSSSLDGRGQVSQEMLINAVRHHRFLRWLRSDLAEESAATLRQE